MRDLRTLNLNLLKALDALLDTHSVTRAAERLNVTQPAMSGMLTRLRDGFDDPLFVRSQRGIVPTQRALALAPALRRILAELDVLLQPVEFDPLTADLTLRIAATDYALSAVALPFLSALKQRAPGIRVALLPVREVQVQTQLEHGELDFALLTPESTPADLHARRLFDERYVCVMRMDHPAAGEPALSLDRFCALEHALVSYNGGSFSGVTDEALARAGRTRRVSLSVQSFLVLPEILRQSDLVAVLPERLVADVPGLRLFDPPVEIPGFTKMLVWHERNHGSPGQRWLRELLVASCGTA
ncbi:MAG: transcriptional regulator [Candidatus Dactylopiibacterium carminicum]|uniref:Transcriptional regulator n=1 Tax=Candidatus Dactylopiibacterium carminicum TaxID=857335 RepID=A0A272EVC4_9RHOO|nr:LysR family transcriptional regulator [Candidatus Dactylopiibacterium carminicum]KAF7600115.1 transcriptional regulator [Candidatus Dactylopiibacterium carminicum]PAS94055.1 MAG: transcriptional regulator [Candidatus Dactylopiibacterium carminicum]PAS98181.1 MAG: transcriptional regulator [Candidatus Dactylopiibacterium carminicum]PAT00115.1 MAG: transcriptional regulator [Candidatus Dactylopiibacterium carminicum]